MTDVRHTYVIGDVHGQFDTLAALLRTIDFDRNLDALWFVGDLVNNGTQNVEVLRWVKALGDRAIVTLGNHDLHMLAVSLGIRPLRDKDTFADVLDAPDAQELLDWLRTRSMAHYDRDTLMIHAGVPPTWDLHTTLEAARALEEALRADDYVHFFENMYGNKPTIWEKAKTTQEKLRFTVNALTRMRVCNEKGKLEFSYKGEIAEVPPGWFAWFRTPNHALTTRTFFGHWSAIGLLREKNFIALDSGCTWGRLLTAYRLEDEAIFQVAAR